MFDRQHGELVIECDECSETEDTYNNDTLEDAWNELKGAGWTVYKDGPNWKHRCPKCSGFTSTRQRRRVVS